VTDELALLPVKTSSSRCSEIRSVDIASESISDRLGERLYSTCGEFAVVSALFQASRDERTTERTDVFLPSSDQVGLRRLPEAHHADQNGLFGDERFVQTEESEIGKRSERN